MELVKEIIIDNPPTKYVDRKKTKIDPKTGKLKENTHYLTANIFYSGIPHYLRSKIINAIKEYLINYMVDIPKLQKARIVLIYSKPQDTFDLDNKAYFWLKVFLDLLKTPSKRQITNAAKKRRSIKSVNCLPDDTVRYIDDIQLKYEKGSHRLIIRIYGDERDKTLFD